MIRGIQLLIIWMKTVDKYQFNEEQGKFDSGIECFLAYHTVIKKYFTLKRMGLAEESDQGLYNYLIREVSILKKLTHDNIYRCYKMLKTKNNLYLIYDNIHADPLATVITQKLSFDCKLSLVKQISSVLVELRKNNLAHLALNLNNIVMQAENKLKVINFGQAQEFPLGQQWLTLPPSFNPTPTMFVPPELFQHKAHLNSDIFSLGMIIGKLFQAQLEKKANGKEPQCEAESKWVTRLSQLTNRMTIKIPDVRIDIKQFQATLNSKFELDQITLTHKSYKSSKSENIIGSTSKRIALNKNAVGAEGAWHSQQKSVGSNKSGVKQKDKGGSADRAGAQQRMGEMEAVMKKILKKRNFVVFLLKMAHASNNNIQAKASNTIVLSYLFIKKAALAITELAKVLKVGRNCDFAIDKKLQEYFVKTNFFSIVNPLINKQMASTHEAFQKITAQVIKLSSFKSNSLLMEEVRHQKMNNSYLRKCVFQFLNSLTLQTTPHYCSNYQLDDVIAIYLISLLSSYKTYEQAHQHLFNQTIQTFEDHPLIKSLRNLDKQTIFEMIEIDLQESDNKYADAISLAKSARTSK